MHHDGPSSPAEVNFLKERRAMASSNRAKLQHSLSANNPHTRMNLHEQRRQGQNDLKSTSIRKRKRCTSRESNAGPIEIEDVILWQRWILPLNH